MESTEAEDWRDPPGGVQKARGMAWKAHSSEAWTLSFGPPHSTVLPRRPALWGFMFSKAAALLQHSRRSPILNTGGSPGRRGAGEGQGRRGRPQGRGGSGSKGPRQSWALRRGQGAGLDSGSRSASKTLHQETTVFRLTLGSFATAEVRASDALTTDSPTEPEGLCPDAQRDPHLLTGQPTCHLASCPSDTI